MERRVELALLIDFYGPLLTEHRRRVLQMHVDEDMSYQEIADGLGITRQGVHDAVEAARKQLDRWEQALGLAARYAEIHSAVAECRACLARINADEATRPELTRAAHALDRIDWMER